MYQRTILNYAGSTIVDIGPAEASPTPLIVLLIDSDEERAKIVEAGLKGAAITKLASSESEDLLASISKLQPDVIIVDCDSPDRNIIENLRLVAKENPKPIVMFVEDGDGSLAKEAVRAGVMWTSNLSRTGGKCWMVEITN